MPKNVIFGTGKSLDPVWNCLKEEKHICEFWDNDRKKNGKSLHSRKILLPGHGNVTEFDFVIVAIVNFANVVEQLNMLNIPEEKIICFYDRNVVYEKYAELFDTVMWKEISFQTEIIAKMETFMKHQRMQIQNMPYEIADRLQKMEYQFPKIRSVEETVTKIIRERCSISRYGDGEFEIIAGTAKDPYQTENDNLAGRLKEILKSNAKNHMVALADDYGELESYNENIRYEIRKYLTEGKRNFHYNFLNMEKVYYNAYISRPYAIYDYSALEEAEKRFLHLKQIWQEREIVLIEGTTTRMGIGNNLFDNATGIERILAPEKNAYDKYQEILNKAMAMERDKLFLIALGSTATVLAFDLAKEGYQALDIGHLDIEYEWFLKGKGPAYIEGKYNNEVYGGELVSDISNEEYNNQIIATIL